MGTTEQELGLEPKPGYRRWYVGRRIHHPLGDPWMNLRVLVHWMAVPDYTDEAIPLPLNPRYDIANHSPDGFECGYPGSGPAQLALALIADALGEQSADVALVRHLYQRFKFDVVAQLPQARGWALDQESILDWIDQHRPPGMLEAVWLKWKRAHEVGATPDGQRQREK